MSLEALNIALFSHINASANPGAASLFVAHVFAVWAIYLLAVWMVAAWIWGKVGFRTALLNGALTIALGLTINRVIGLFWTHPRPFAMGLGNQFLPHAADSSFPSDHGTLVFSLALALLLSQRSRIQGVLVLLIGIGVAWSRIFLGVHFPLDMAGSFLVAIISAGLIRLVSNGLAQSVYPPIQTLYEAILRGLRLPPRIFPRHP